MATDPPQKDQQQQQQQSTSLEPWTQSQHEQALSHLSNLQSQIDRLRTAIPSIVTPLAQPHKGRTQIYAQVKKAAVQATGELQAFREAWGEERTEIVLGRARESLRGDGRLERAGEVGRWGWGDRVTGEEEKGEGEEEKGV